MKKILVTGCSGYIGSHLCKMLKDQEYIVHGLDIEEPKVEIDYFYKLDINRIFNIEIEYDCVIHLAALVRVNEGEEKPIMYYITNVNGTMNVLSKITTDNFIFASTGAAEYATSVYGMTKAMAEKIVSNYRTEQANRNYTIFRFYNVIGGDVVPPTNPDGLMYNLLKSLDTKQFTIHGNEYDTEDGTCVRDYVHVDEICESIISAIDNPSNNIECLGHGEGFSVKEMVEVFQAVNNVNIDVTYGPARSGDLPYTVLEEVSPYMVHRYTIPELLTIR